MSASIVRLTESAFHEILQFVASTSRFAERQPLVDSLRTLATKVLNLDEMVIGRCGGEWDSGRRDRCSSFDQMMSMAEVAPAKASSPCSSNAGASKTCGGSASPKTAGFQNNEPAGRVVVCHRRIVDDSSLCIVSSAKKQSHDELSAVLKTLLPYLDEAFRRVDPPRGQHALPPQLDAGEQIVAEPTAPLTCREREVLYWTAQGKGCWETGHIVGISERTVKFHLANVYRKLNVVNRAQAVARAAQINLIQ